MEQEVCFINQVIQANLDHIIPIENNIGQCHSEVYNIPNSVIDEEANEIEESDHNDANNLPDLSIYASLSIVSIMLSLSLEI